MLNKFKNDEGGFTLIELLVVILIIGILAAVALPTFLGQAEKGREATAKSDLRAVATKVQACATDESGPGYASCITSSTNGTKITGEANQAGTGYTLTASVANYKTDAAWTLTGGDDGVSEPTDQ